MNKQLPISLIIIGTLMFIVGLVLKLLYGLDMFLEIIIGPIVIVVGLILIKRQNAKTDNS